MGRLRDFVPTEVARWCRQVMDTQDYNRADYTSYDDVISNLKIWLRWRIAQRDYDIMIKANGSKYRVSSSADIRWNNVYEWASVKPVEEQIDIYYRLTTDYVVDYDKGGHVNGIKKEL